MDSTDLVTEMSKISPKELNKLVELSQKKRGDLLVNNIPVSEIEKLKIIYDKYMNGQTLNCEVDLPLKISVKIQAEHEYGHPADWDVSLNAEKASFLAREFFSLVEDGLKSTFLDDSCCLETLVPGAEQACVEESKHYREYQNALDDFEEKYSVSPFIFLQSKKDHRLTLQLKAAFDEEDHLQIWSAD